VSDYNPTSRKCKCLDCRSTYYYDPSDEECPCCGSDQFVAHERTKEESRILGSPNSGFYNRLIKALEEAIEVTKEMKSVDPK
jgi:hypothetical protein